jgi:hypothetical protein
MPELTTSWQNRSKTGTQDAIAYDPEEKQEGKRTMRKGKFETQKQRKTIKLTSLEALKSGRSESLEVGEGVSTMAEGEEKGRRLEAGEEEGDIEAEGNCECEDLAGD